jgi:hypothetical protein
MCYTRKEERDLEREARRFCEVRLVGICEVRVMAFSEGRYLESLLSYRGLGCGFEDAPRAA